MIRSKKEELRGTLAALIDLRKDFETRITSIADPQLREYEGISLNNKRLIHLEAAEYLATQIPDHVSSAEYGVLGNEHRVDSNFTQAAHYYQKAIDASRTVVTKIFSMRALASLYFSPGSCRDFGKGRKYFSEAAEVVKNPDDPYLVYTVGNTYELWGLYELWNGFQVEGNQMIERARKYYLDLPDYNIYKKQALELLEKKVKQIVQPNLILQPTPLK